MVAGQHGLMKGQVLNGDIRGQLTFHFNIQFIDLK